MTCRVRSSCLAGPTPMFDAVWSSADVTKKASWLQLIMEPNSWSCGLNFFGVSKVHSWIIVEYVLLVKKPSIFGILLVVTSPFWIFCCFDPERWTLGTTAWFFWGVPGWPLPKPKRPEGRFPATDSGGGMEFSYECLNKYMGMDQ